MLTPPWTPPPRPWGSDSRFLAEAAVGLQRLGRVVEAQMAGEVRRVATPGAPVRPPAQRPPVAGRGGSTGRPRPPAPAEPQAEASAVSLPADADAEVDVLAVIERARAGDAEAFGVLYDRNVDTVYRYVYYRVGNVALAEDLVSETFLRALRRMDSFTYQGRDVAAWFITIARNLIADHFKSSRFKLELSTDDLVNASGDRASHDDPESSVLASLSSRALVAAVKKLNPEQQECVVLRFLQGLSVAETALAMGKNEGAIKALQYRAVRSLARLVPAGSL